MPTRGGQGTYTNGALGMRRVWSRGMSDEDETVWGRVEVTKEGWMREDWRDVLAAEIVGMAEDLVMTIQAKREIEGMVNEG